MISAKVLKDSLESVLGEGIDVSLLISLSGTILGVATTPDRRFDTNIIASVVSNMWVAYSSNDLMPPSSTESDFKHYAPEGLEALLVEIGEVKVCTVNCGGTALLCLSGRDTEFGALKLRIAALQRHIDGPVRALSIV
eukprot:Tbor_TRINITY_DN5429_c3_g2::TRINITY_DN5429_c3_g2_i1::g.24681::m.24681/K20398/LAMTOR2; ragulator complex protein LAMTOR2